MLDPQENDPRRYNRPTVDEVAVIIVRPEDDNEAFERDIVIQDHDTGRLQNIFQHSPRYISLHYPFLFPHTEEGWHTRIPLSGVDLANNVNLQARHHTRIELEEGGDEGEPDDVLSSGRTMMTATSSTVGRL